VDPIALLRSRLRKSRRLREAVRGAMHARIPPTPLHSLLLAERCLRRSAWYELARLLYYQPLFELHCAQVGEGGRLELTPESKLPFVDNCALVLGAKWRINARTAFQGARNAPGKARIEIGEGTYIGSRAVLRAGLGIRLGRFVTLAANVVLSSDPGHPLDPLARRTEAAPLEALGQMVVGDDVWIAEGATLLGGITVGDAAIIGAHAVVTKDVPARTVVAGNPARVVKKLDPVLLHSTSSSTG
jgi:acetyltransferase-like isoleucine patch superfamily enzyme